MVDSWPMEWSSGWLLERAFEYENDREKWKDMPIGLAEFDADGEDPWWGNTSEPPPEIYNLPLEGGE